MSPRTGGADPGTTGPTEPTTTPATTTTLTMVTAPVEVPGMYLPC